MNLGVHFSVIPSERLDSFKTEFVSNPRCANLLSQSSHARIVEDHKNNA
jgi:hypothetical protein